MFVHAYSIVEHLNFHVGSTPSNPNHLRKMGWHPPSTTTWPWPRGLGLRIYQVHWSSSKTSGSGELKGQTLGMWWELWAEGLTFFPEKLRYFPPEKLASQWENPPFLMGDSIFKWFGFPLKMDGTGRFMSFLFKMGEITSFSEGPKRSKSYTQLRPVESTTSPQNQWKIKNQVIYHKNL